MFRSISRFRRVMGLQDLSLLIAPSKLKSYSYYRTTKLKAPIVSTFGAFCISLVVLFSMATAAFGQTNYIFEIIAQTGVAIEGSDSIPVTNPILDLGSGPSINNLGKVAFVAYDEPGIHGRVMVVNQQGVVERNFQIPPTERIGTDVQINDEDQVVWWRQIEAPGSQLNQDTLVQRLDTENSGEIIARGTITDWFDTIWDYASPYATLNNNGLVVFTGDLDPNKSIGNRVLASRNGGSGSYEMTGPIAGLPTFFPMLSDPTPSGDSRIVFRFGDNNNDPLYVITRNDMNAAISVADSVEFDLVGKKPGISDDGSVVAFLAESKNLESGIYMGVINIAGDDSVTFKLADTPSLESTLSTRVGVNRSKGLAKDYTVVYMAKDSNGELSLFETRVDVSNPFQHEVLEGPNALVTVGMPIDGLEELGNVTNIGLYDPINNYGQFVFWVETDAGEEAILRTKPEQRIYIDWTNTVSTDWMFARYHYISPDNVEYGVLESYIAARRKCLQEEITNETCFASEPVLELLDENFKNQVLEHVQDIFDESKIPIPIEIYDGEERKDNAIYVRFAKVLPETKRYRLGCFKEEAGHLLGKAWYGGGRFNKRVGGEAAIFLRTEGEDSDLEKPKFVAERIAHEAGHLLGLKHINTYPLSTEEFPNPKNIEVMDYDTPEAPDFIEEFTNTRGNKGQEEGIEARILDPPFQELINKKDVAGKSCISIGETHNPIYHLRRWVLGESDDSLVDKGIEPGDYDLKKPTKKGSGEFQSLDYEGFLYDLTILGPDGQNLDSGAEGFSVIASFDIVDPDDLSKLKWTFRPGEHLRIAASSTPGKLWDLYFSIGESTNTIWTPDDLMPGIISGTVIQFLEENQVFEVVGTFTAFIEHSTPQLVTVPNVESLPQVDAEIAIVGAGLIVGIVTNQNSDSVTEGNVISQDPAPGSEVAAATPVDLVVSSGPEPAIVAVPDVIGFSEDDATTTITSSGLTVGTKIPVLSGNEQYGNVISQNPAPGTSVPEGIAVDLEFSVIIEQTVVPNVVGMEQSFAESAIIANDLTVGTVTTQYSDTVPAGYVISQNPAPGTTVDVKTQVNLVVSLGSETMTVPSVEGISQAEAGAAIINAGFTVGTITMEYSDTVSAGHVISQNPVAGTSVIPGTEVNLVVSLGPATSLVAPQNIQAVHEDSQVTITWDPVGGATSYNIYWNTTGNVTTADSQISGVSSPYSHDSLTNDTTYYYIVTAIDADGESAPSSEVSAIPSGSVSTTIIDTLPQSGSLAAAGSLAQGGTFVATGTNLAEFTINVTMSIERAARPIVLGTTESGTPTLGPVLWEGPDVITPYSGEITFSPNVPLTVGERYFIGLDYGFLTSVVGDVILLGSRSDDPIPNGQAWRAFSGGWDPFSPGVDIAARIVMHSPTPTPPGTPQNVQAVAGDEQITIDWDAVTGANSYNIYWNTTGNVTTDDNKVSDVTSPFTHPNLTKGTTYYYIVTAINDIGESSPSMEVSAYLTKYWEIISMLDKPAMNVIAIGNKAYLASCHDLIVVDITEATNPFVIETVRFSNSCRNTRGLAVVDNAAYVPYWDSSTNKSGIKVIELSDLSTSEVIGSVEIPNDVQQISVTGNRAYVVDDSRNLNILDIAEPLNPRLIGPIEGLGMGISCITVKDDLAYVGGYDYSFTILDISDRTNPTIIGSLPLNWAFSNDSVMVGSEVYVATSDGLKIIHVSDVSNPVLKGSLDANYGFAITTSGETAFLADLNVGLQVVNISDAVNPFLIDTVVIPNQTTDVSVLNQTAYVVGNGGFYIVAAKNLPEVTHIEDKVMEEGGTLTVPITATDPGGATLTLSVEGLPSFGTFTDNGDGTGTIVFNPGPGDTGTFFMTVTAINDIVSDFGTFTLTVSAHLPDLGSGLLAYWTFDNCDANDETGNGYNGTMSGGPACVDGVMSKALDFDAVNDHIKLNKTINPNEMKALSFWLNSRGVDGVNELGTVIAKYSWHGRRSFLIDTFDIATNRIRTTLYSDGVSYNSDRLSSYYEDRASLDPNIFTLFDNSELEINTWKHVVVNIKETEIEIWIEGALVSKRSREYQQFFNSSEPTYIGNAFLIGSDFVYNYRLNGILDDFRIYSRPLSAAEIQLLGQPDSDGDGIPNDNDLCPNTTAGTAVDENGCWTGQLDSDSDGVLDGMDQCPDTPVGATVNDDGCSLGQLDSDDDGVMDDIDECPGTPAGVTVDIAGCELTVVPDVVGLSLSEAGAAIIDAKLNVGKVRIGESNTIEIGKAMDQNPLGGMEVSIGTQVDFVISYSESYEEKGWRRTNFDLGGTAYYPFTSAPNSGKLGLLWEVPGMSNAAVLTVDLNNDDILDIVASDGSSLNAYDGQGNVLWSVNTSAMLQYIGDIDADLQPEIFVSYKDGNNHLKVDVYNADGTLDKTLDRGPSGYDSYMSILTHDVDNLIVGYGAGYSLSPRGVGILRYSWGGEDAYFATGGGGLWGTFGMGDSDNDGLLEIALPWGTPHNGASANGTTDGDLYGVLLEADTSVSPSTLSSQFMKQISSWNPSTNPNGYDSAMMPDLDGDGISEILFLEGHDSTYYSGSNYVYNVTPNGTLISSWQGPYNGWFPLGTLINDINSDGIKELVMSARNNETVSIISGSTFTSTSVNTCSDTGRVLGATDIDGDGQDEIIVHQSNSGNIRVLNTGDLTEISSWNIGSFSPITFDQLNRFVISDVTGDGNFELILGATHGLYVLGTGQGIDGCPEDDDKTQQGICGCGVSDVDTDCDSVPNCIDLCPGTPPDEPISATGCSTGQDVDGDGIPNDIDQCQNTPAGEDVDENGCSASQRDSDGDGVMDDMDQCSDTSLGAVVNADGCSLGQLDGDGDGIMDDVDLCPNTPAGAATNDDGCSPGELDGDGDGVMDDVDLCPETPPGATVDVDGCPLTVVPDVTGLPLGDALDALDEAGLEPGDITPQCLSTITARGVLNQSPEAGDEVSLESSIDLTIPVNLPEGTIPATLVPAGRIGETQVFMADLSQSGLSHLGSITIVDDGTPFGGAAGIFSGFDVDTIFLDADGDLSTHGDRHYATNYRFEAGTTRETADPAMLPNNTHPGPTFGSFDHNTIDLATAALDQFDAINVANVDIADGVLSLGDGGALTVDFSPEVAVNDSLFLIVGEVGGQAGERLVNACIGISEDQFDHDGDGVKDNMDQCPDTPAGVPVNEDGCALGACMFPDGSCAQVAERDCLNASDVFGEYQGDSTQCVQTGACILPDNCCAVMTSEDCSDAGGTFDGNHTACEQYQFELPNVTGLSEPEASALLSDSCLHVETECAVPETPIPAGEVLYQDPPAGTPVTDGDTVYLGISDGMAAAPFTAAGRGSGVFIKPKGPGGMVTDGIGTNHFSWGIPTTASGIPSGLTFEGSSFSVETETEFTIGTLTYTNGTISGSSDADIVDLRIDIAFSLPDGINRSFIYHFELIDTPNIRGASDERQADIVRLSSFNSPVVFTVDEVTYTLKLTFGNVIESNGWIKERDSFFVYEAQSASAKLRGKFTACASEVDHNPASDKENALALLESLTGSGPKSQKELEKAIKELKESLGNLHPEGDKKIEWLDMAHLSCKDGHKVFSKEKKAVEKLEKIKDASIARKLKKAIDLMVQADRLLASTAITEAPDSKDKDKAQKEFQKAEAETKNKKKIEIYKKAWKHINKHCDKDKKKSCIYEITVESPVGDEVSAIGDKVGHPDTIFTDIDDNLVKIHTSCSRCIFEGQLIDGWKIKEIRDVDGNIPQRLAEKCGN